MKKPVELLVPEPEPAVAPDDGKSPTIVTFVRHYLRVNRFFCLEISAQLMGSTDRQWLHSLRISDAFLGNSNNHDVTLSVTV